MTWSAGRSHPAREVHLPRRIRACRRRPVGVPRSSATGVRRLRVRSMTGRSRSARAARGRWGHRADARPFAAEVHRPPRRGGTERAQHRLALVLATAQGRSGCGVLSGRGVAHSRKRRREDRMRSDLEQPSEPCVEEPLERRGEQRRLAHVTPPVGRRTRRRPTSSRSPWRSSARGRPRAAPASAETSSSRRPSSWGP